MINDITRRARRYSAGRTVLDLLAIVFLCCSIAFWGVLHWQVLVTPGGALPQIIVAAVMTLIYSLALPVLLSALVPSTPAGQLLQKTQWATIGFWVVIPAVAFLLWHAYTLMISWFAAQPAIAEAQLERPYTISALIAFVVIVALAWTQVSPERWLREIQQAHEVKKLELMQRGEIAIIKARLLWAEQRAAVSYAMLLPAEQQEVRDTLKGLLMGIADTQRSIARTMGLQGEIERDIMGDEEIASSLDYVARQLEKPAQSIERSITWIDDPNRENGASSKRLDDAAHVNTRLQSSIPSETSPAQSDQAGLDPAAAARVYEALAHRLPAIFTAVNVSDLMQWQDKRPAQRVIQSWIAQGLAAEVRLGRYRLTE